MHVNGGEVVVCDELVVVEVCDVVVVAILGKVVAILVKVVAILVKVVAILGKVVAVVVGRVAVVDGMILLVTIPAILPSDIDDDDVPPHSSTFTGAKPILSFSLSNIVRKPLITESPMIFILPAEEMEDGI